MNFWTQESVFKSDDDKKNPILEIRTDSMRRAQRPFTSFGLMKAKAILACLPAIEAFVAKHSQEGGS